MKLNEKLHKCNLEDHQIKEFKTTINKVDISIIEEKMKENPMMLIPA